MTHQEAQSLLPAGIMLTQDDYLLGVFDMVGELMRFAITSMATSGGIPGHGAAEGEAGVGDGRGRDVVTDMRLLRSHLESLNMNGSSASKDVEKKMDVMKSCVEKVENAAYGMIVRGKERPKGWVPDTREEERGPGMVESY
jgi:predicted translin family RNA/ssDNA-binding protein